MPYGQARIPIGKRRERVAIQEAVLSTSDALGGQEVIRWRTVAEPWAAVHALEERTKEGLIAQQVMARHSYHVAIPYQSGITPLLRIIVRDTTMQIHTVTDDEGRRRRLVLYVGEVQNG